MKTMRKIFVGVELTIHHNSRFCWLKWSNRCCRNLSSDNSACAIASHAIKTKILIIIKA